MSTISTGHNDSAGSKSCTAWCTDWWHSDRLDSLAWAALFLWGALVLLLDATGYVASAGWWDGWGVFFTGAGAIVLLEAAIRLVVPDYRASWWWSLIVGAVLLCIGLDAWDGWDWVWALVVAAIGLAILRGAFARTT